MSFGAHATHRESLVKSLYLILEHRQQNKRLADQKTSKLSRAKSEAILPLGKVSRSFRTSNNQLTAAIKGFRDKDRVDRPSSQRLTVPIPETMQMQSQVQAQMHCIRPVERTLSSAPEGREQTSSLRLSSGMKRGRFSAWFNTSDAHLVQKQISSKSLEELSREVEDILDSIGATYSFNKRRDKIKARAVCGKLTFIRLFAGLTRQGQTGRPSSSPSTLTLPLIAQPTLSCSLGGQVTKTPLGSSVPTCGGSSTNCERNRSSWPLFLSFPPKLAELEEKPLL